MQSRPKKQTDIALIGDGPLIEAVQASLTHDRAKSIQLRDIEKAHFIQKGVVVYDGERINAKRFFVALPAKTHMPAIKSLDATKYTELEHGKSYNPKGTVLIIGGGELAVHAALSFADKGISVSLLYPHENLLEKYDTSIQDVMIQYLKKHKVKLHSSHVPIASLTKAGKTYVLAKNESGSKKFACDSLFVEPLQGIMNDVGLPNYGLFQTNLENPVVAEKGLIIVRGDEQLSNLGDARLYARMLQKKRSKQPRYMLNISYELGSVRLFSAGIIEQDFSSTHIAYRKAIVKIPIESSDVIGFIKVLVSLKGRVIGVSGIVEPNYLGLNLLRMAVKNNLFIHELIDLVDVHDPIMGAYLEIQRETA